MNIEKELQIFVQHVSCTLNECNRVFSVMHDMVTHCGILQKLYSYSTFHHLLIDIITFDGGGLHTSECDELIQKQNGDPCVDCNNLLHTDITYLI